MLLTFNNIHWYIFCFYEQATNIYFFAPEKKRSFIYFLFSRVVFAEYVCPAALQVKGVNCQEFTIANNCCCCRFL